MVVTCGLWLVACGLVGCWLALVVVVWRQGQEARDRGEGGVGRESEGRGSGTGGQGAGQQGGEWGSIWGGEKDLSSEALCLMLYLLYPLVPYPQ